MNPEAKQASFVIDSVSKAVANWTVDQHAEAKPQLVRRYGPAWRVDWVRHTLAQLTLLAQATAVRSAELFVHSIRWTYGSFTSRGIDETDLMTNITCMREVLAREVPPSVAALALPFVDQALQQLSAPDPGFDNDSSTRMEYREPMLRYLNAVLEGNRSEAESVIREAREGGMTIPMIYEQVLAPAQARLGWMWHRGEISIADEHFGSATTQTVMSQLRLHFHRSAPKGRTVVGTATAGDLHEIGLRMVTDLFEMDGWDVVYLGANTPAADIVELLARRNADLLALSVSTALTLRDAGELIERIRSTRTIAETKVLVGGPPFKAVEGLWQELEADGCAQSASEAVLAGNELVSS